MVSIVNMQNMTGEQKLTNYQHFKKCIDLERKDYKHHFLWVGGITEDFLIHFGLDDIKDLPGFDELKAAGLLDSEPSGIFSHLSKENMAEDDEDELDSEEEF